MDNAGDPWVTDTQAERRVKMEASDKPWKPKNRVREVSTSLKTFAALATSADKGAVRDVTKLENL